MKLNLKNLAYNVVVALLLASVVTMFAGVTAGVLSGSALLAAGFLLPAKPAGAQAGLAFMAIQQEVWATDIAENVFPDNSFMNRAQDDSDKLVGRTVHLPQAGAPPTAQKNRAGSAAPAKRVDTVSDYVIDEFTTDPTVVTITEEIEVSYDKRMDVLKDHVEVLRTLAADSLCYNWAPTAASNIIYTTGVARDVWKVGHQTGQRLAVARNDFANAARILNRMNVPQEGRVALVDADMAMDLMTIPEFISANIFGKPIIENGVLGRVFGFDIMIRSQAALYAPNGTVKDMAAAKAATDCASTMFWHPNYVRKAVGTATNGGIHVFEQNSSPTHYGDIMSAMVRAGGKHRYADQRGVVVLVEKTPA
jgi:hypothetical protein